MTELLHDRGSFAPIKYIHTFVTSGLEVSPRRILNEGVSCSIEAALSIEGRSVMKRLVDRFGEAASSCDDFNQLRVLLHDVSRELGFEYFALLHHSSLSSSSGTRIRLDNYPVGWVEELVALDLVAHDPVHLASRRMNSGFAWTEIGSIIALMDRQKGIFSRSRRHGLGQGFTVPANVPGEPSGSCSFAVRAEAELPRQRLMCAELVGAHAFRAARRIGSLPQVPQRPHLSRREIECLRLVAGGKTDWEASRILGLSIETVRQYVKRARAAYDVVSRAQLVVHGLRDDWVSFEDAIPPSG